LTDLREKDEEGNNYVNSFYSEGGIVELNNVMVEVAMMYNSGYSEHVYSYVNNINTIEGGTHVSGFRRALTRVFKSYGDKNGLFEKAKVEIEGDDFREGLSSIIYGTNKNQIG